MNKIKHLAPVFTLMMLAPMIAEILPGATRLSTIFVLPVEICVWGSAAMLIRYIVRKWDLKWTGMLLLAIALSLAEEIIIQQTSVAPMVLQLKGITYARYLGVNYVYLTWALIYESVFVVFLPVYITELIFSERKDELWIGNRGVKTLCIIFAAGSVLAWYSWTQMARPLGFHVEIYNPPIQKFLLGIALIGGLVLLAFKPITQVNLPKNPLKSPLCLILGIAGALWAIVLYGIVLLGFGISPSFPPLIAVMIGLILAFIPLYFLPRMTNSPTWKNKQVFSLLSGVISGSMLAGFIAFWNQVNSDLYFKILMNLVAFVLLVLLRNSIWKQPEQELTNK
jgi:hypothetical protein